MEKCGKLDNRMYLKSHLNDRGTSVEIHKNGALFKCLKCGKHFNYSLELKRHNFTFHMKTYNCSICQLSFLDSETLSLHENVIHCESETNGNGANCVTEGKNISTSVLRLPPSTDCDLPKPCAKSEFSDADPDLKPIPICIVCCETFKCESELRLHEERGHSVFLTGDEISPDLPKPTSVISVEDNITPDPQNPTDSSYLFDVLKEVYSPEETNAYKLSLKGGANSADSYIQRSRPGCISENGVNRMRVTVYQCNVCYEKYKSLSDLQNHRKNHFKEIDCPICRVTFFRDIDLSEHLKKNHMKDFSKIIFKTGTEVINEPTNAQLGGVNLEQTSSNSVVYSSRLREMNKTCYSRNISKDLVVSQQKLIPNSTNLEKSCQDFKSVSVDRVCKLVLKRCDALISQTGDTASNSFLSEKPGDSINNSSQDFKATVDSQSDPIVTCKTEIKEEFAMEIANTLEEISIQQHCDLCKNEIFSDGSQSVVTSAQPELNSESFKEVIKTEIFNNVGESSVQPKICKIIFKSCDEKPKILPPLRECKVVLTRCDEMLYLDFLDSSKRLVLRNADEASEKCSSRSSSSISDSSSSITDSSSSISDSSSSDYNSDTSFRSKKRLKVDKPRIVYRKLKLIQQKQKHLKETLLAHDNSICCKGLDNSYNYFICPVCELSFSNADFFAFHVKMCTVTKLVDI